MAGLGATFPFRLMGAVANRFPAIELAPVVIPSTVMNALSMS
ncbi:hypothetical protein [uncultured Paracoccus sp.]|nr:hypothetical protein [uncultured Paracoccus sp.]